MRAKNKNGNTAGWSMSYVVKFINTNGIIFMAATFSHKEYAVEFFNKFESYYSDGYVYDKQTKKIILEK